MWEHIPILIVAQVACSKCLAMGEQYYCKTCNRDGGYEVFDDEKTCLKMFLTYLHSLKTEKVKKVVVCSHNGGAYDLIFVLKEILLEHASTPDEKLQVINNGNKIIKIEYKGLKFIDTLNYFMCPLRKLPKVFNLGQTTKGYFPFLYARADNKNYVGPLPDEKYYMPGGMSDTEYKEFKAWYDTEKKRVGDMFDIKEEMLKYCQKDVTILRRASCTFENDFYKETGVYPLKNCVTIASACMASYRTRFYKEDTIGIIPRGGYRLVNRHSKISLEWLEWRAWIEGVHVQHAGNGLEKKIGCYRVDGYSKKPDGEEMVYEYLGCYHHGHNCMEQTTRNTVLYKNTLARINHIKSMGYKVTFIWGCHYEEEKKSNGKLQRFLETYDPDAFTSPLNPRDAFFGGHTCAFRTHHKAAEGESIRYLDFMSLYPYINKYGVYPLGHPNVYLGDDAGCPPLKDVLGLIKCTVVPPRNLFFPVLPFRSDDEKLLFALCRTCALDQNQSTCPHERDEDRAFSGTWCSPELQAAMKKGYKVTKVTEVWHYEKKTDGGEGLFTGYVNSFLKGKQEASGWPSSCVTEEDKQRYMDAFFAAEGVMLDRDRIVRNEGLRTIYKLLLNSLWGKFGQRDDLTRTEFLHTLEDEMKLLHRLDVVDVNLTPMTEDVLMASYKMSEAEESTSLTKNVVIAAFTTCLARLRLLEAMEKVGEDLLYVDTDSLIFVSREGEEARLPTGDNLGQLQDEMPEGARILSFASAGAKNYGYLIGYRDSERQDAVVKVRGITITKGVSDVVNYENLERMVLGEVEEVQEVINPKKIRRLPNFSGVVSTRESKRWQTCHTKRRMVGVKSLPFGYKDT